MKIFERNYKINFVDDNNVFVGFDYSDQCCENYGYILSKNLPFSPNPIIEGEDFPNFNFDTTYFLDELPEFKAYEGGTATFKLIEKETNEIMYLTLYNIQNGYYSHGFEMLENNKVLKTGRI